MRFTNLKNIYGHVSVVDGTELPSNSGFQLFVNGGAYKGYPPFMAPIGDGYFDSTWLRTNTFFDLIEKNCKTIGPLLSNVDNLSPVSSYMKNNFLSCTGDNLYEFDTNEWATNYTVSSLNSVCRAKGSLNEFWLQYLMYRYAINVIKDQKDNTTKNIHLLGSYVPTNVGGNGEI